jgi:hypothetical protein
MPAPGPPMNCCACAAPVARNSVARIAGINLIMQRHVAPSAWQRKPWPLIEGKEHLLGPRAIPVMTEVALEAANIWQAVANSVRDIKRE